MIPILIQKYPDATVDLVISYASRLAAGETLVSATATVLGAGTITVAPLPVVTSPLVTVRLAAGTNGMLDSFVVLATTSLGQVLDAMVWVQVTIGATPPFSYSTPERLAARIGPKIFAQLTSEGGGYVPDDAVAQGMLLAAAQEINIRIGSRYTVPVLAPAFQVSLLAGLEEQIAFWFLWVRRGIGDQESAASAAKVGYDAAMKFLDAIAAGDIDLTGVTPRPTDTTATGGPSGWKSNAPVYTGENFRRF